MFRQSGLEILDEEKIGRIPQQVYQDTIYFGPTIRYIEIDLENPRHRFYLEKGLEIFVYDSIYRNILSGDDKDIDGLRSKYGDIQARVRNQGSFFGVGGCTTFEEAAGYAYGQLGKGIFIGINTLQNDQYRIKIDANKIYQKLYGCKNEAAGEREILHMYLDEQGALLRHPVEGVRRSSFLPYVAWAIDSKAFYKCRLLSPSVHNLLQPGEMIDLRTWLLREQEKASEQRTLFLSNQKPKIAPSMMFFSSEDADELSEKNLKVLKKG